MRNWAIVLHFYQPPTQSLLVTKEIAHACYLPLIDLLVKTPHAKISLNLSATLLLQMESLAMKSFFENINLLLVRGQIELLTSAMYHPLLPLVTADIGKKLIDKQNGVLKYFFPKANLKMLFPPELAVDANVMDRVCKMGLDILVDESSINQDWHHHRILASKAKYNNRTILVSSRILTEIFRSYPMYLDHQRFLEYFWQNTYDDQLVVSVHDAEIFGHHYSERLDFLKNIFTEIKKINFMTVSQVLEHKGWMPTLDSITTSTWQTSREDLEKEEPYSLWLTKDNDLQRQYYRLSNFVHRHLQTFHPETVEQENYSNDAWERYYRGVSSCYAYWLSNWPWWHPDLVQSGATELVKAIRTLDFPKSVKLQNESTYHNFLHDMWQYHWSGRVEQRYADYSKFREKLLKELPKI